MMSRRCQRLSQLFPGHRPPGMASALWPRRRGNFLKLPTAFGRTRACARCATSCSWRAAVCPRTRLHPPVALRLLVDPPRLGRGGRRARARHSRCSTRSWFAPPDHPGVAQARHVHAPPLDAEIGNNPGVATAPRGVGSCRSGAEAETRQHNEETKTNYASSASSEGSCGGDAMSRIDSEEVSARP